MSTNNDSTLKSYNVIHSSTRYYHALFGDLVNEGIQFGPDSEEKLARAREARIKYETLVRLHFIETSRYNNQVVRKLQEEAKAQADAELKDPMFWLEHVSYFAIGAVATLTLLVMISPVVDAACRNIPFWAEQSTSNCVGEIWD